MSKQKHTYVLYVQWIVLVDKTSTLEPDPPLPQSIGSFECCVFPYRSSAPPWMGWSTYQFPQLARVKILESFSTINPLCWSPMVQELEIMVHFSHYVRTMKSNHSWLIHNITKECTMGGPALGVHCNETDQ